MLFSGRSCVTHMLLSEERDKHRHRQKSARVLGVGKIGINISGDLSLVSFQPMIDWATRNLIQKSGSAARGKGRERDPELHHPGSGGTLPIVLHTKADSTIDPALTLCRCGHEAAHYWNTSLWSSPSQSTSAVEVNFLIKSLHFWPLRDILSQLTYKQICCMDLTSYVKFVARNQNKKIQAPK